MTIRTSWPWITGLIAIAAIFNPFGLAVVGAAWNGEQVARQIGQMLFWIGAGGLVAVALLEFGIRKYLMARQRRKNAQATSGARNG